MRFEEGQIIDSDGNMQEVNAAAATPRMVELDGRRSTITVVFPDRFIRKKGIGLNVNVVLVDENARKRIQVYYEVKSELNRSLIGIDITDLLSYDPNDSNGITTGAGGEGDKGSGGNEEGDISKTIHTKLQAGIVEQIRLGDFANDSQYSKKSLLDLLEELDTKVGAKQIIFELQEEGTSILEKTIELRGEIKALKRKENLSVLALERKGTRYQRST